MFATKVIPTSPQLAWSRERRLTLDLGTKALEKIIFYKCNLEYFQTVVHKNHVIFMLTMNYHLYLPLTKKPTRSR